MALFPPWNPLQNINARVRPFQKVQAHHKNKPLSTEISWISLSTLKILRLFKSNSWFYFFSSHLFKSFTWKCHCQSLIWLVLIIWMRFNITIEKKSLDHSFLITIKKFFVKMFITLFALFLYYHSVAKY